MNAATRVGAWTGIVLAAWLGLVPAAGSEGPIGFSEVSVSAGVSYLQQQPQVPLDCVFFMGISCEAERMTGGAAAGDVDGDGDLDLFVTRFDASDILFRNLGNGFFEDAGPSAGFDALVVQSNGAAFGDIDNDGDLDLYVTVVCDAGDTPNNRNYLFINDGNGVFAEDAVARGAAVPNPGIRRVYSASFGDYDRDGWLDLHTTEWLPDDTSNSRLLHNLGSSAPGFFEDATVAAGVTLDESSGFASTFTDLDGDRWPDLAVVADFQTSRLFWNHRDGTFTDGTAAAHVGTDQNGMGSNFGDLEGDGDLDWFVTSIYDSDQTCETEICNWGYEGNRLYRNDGGREFTDVTDSAGVANGFWGWGAAFFDHDNDGDLDLVMTNGVEFPTTPFETPFNDDPMRMWDNDGSGIMSEISATLGLTDTGTGKGLLVFDYDDDGDQDLFIVNNGSTPRLYRNDLGNANSWLRVRTVGSVSNRGGLGARITGEASAGGPRQVREIGTCTHFLAQSEPVAHFGLGAGIQPVSSVVVEWPSGLVQGFAAVARNATLVADEAACTDGDGDLYCSSADCNDDDAAVHAGATELCDGVDNDCDDVTDEACVAGAGAVPDGHTVPGTQLTMGKTDSDSVTLFWSASCAAADDDYEVYEGTLGNFAGPLGISCGTAGETSVTIPMGSGSTYYLVAPGNAGIEGSHGKRSDGTERPQGLASCLPRGVEGCL